MSETYDVIIIGAGAMGSAAAYYLAKRGASVLLIEQFELDHQRGSSYGHSRIIRYSYDVVDYIALARPNYELWAALQEEAGETLMVTTGGIDFGLPDDKTLSDTRRSMQAMNIAHDILNADEANRRFPQFHFDDGMQVIYQADSGLLAASRCVRAHVRLAQKYSAVFQDHEPVISLNIATDSVTVTTEKGKYSAGKLIVTAGAWAARLLEPTGLTLPFETLRCQLQFFEPQSNPAQYDAAQMPIFIYHRDNDLRQVVYGIPSHQNTGVKAAFHGGEKRGHPTNVDYAPDAATVERLRGAVGEQLSVVQDGKLKESRICLYTETPDGHFVIDHHPQHAHVIIGGGFSGHGFKFSTLIGSILADLALDGSTEHDISLFKADRF